MQPFSDEFQNIVLVLSIIIIILLIAFVYYKINTLTNETQEIDQRNYFNSINMNNDKIDNLITNNEDSIPDLLTKKITPPKKYINKISIIYHNSIIQIKYSSSDYSSNNIDV